MAQRAKAVLVVRAPGVALVNRENGVVTARIRERGSSPRNATCFKDAGDRTRAGVDVTSTYTKNLNPGWVGS